MTKRSLPKKLLLSSVLVLFCFVLLEGLASTLIVLVDFWKGERRTAGGETNIQYDAELGWTSIPNLHVPDMFGEDAYLRTNRQGFRSNREFIPQAVAPGKIRAVCSGDSFTFGYGVSNDHTWCRQLEERISTLETVNLGEIGYGIDQAYLRYRRDGAQLNHQIQLFAFITTDFHRMGRDQFLGYGKPVLQWKDDRLEVLNVPVPQPAMRMPWWLEKRLPKLERLRMAELLTGLLRRLSAFKEHETDRSREIFDLSVQVFRELDRLNRERGSQLVLMHLPINVDHRSESSVFWRESLRAAAAENGWIYWDLVEEIRKLKASETRGYFRPEGHYTLAGNLYIADQIARRLQSDPRLGSMHPSP